jgi:hypothetical protein
MRACSAREGTPSTCCVHSPAKWSSRLPHRSLLSRTEDVAAGLLGSVATPMACTNRTGANRGAPRRRGQTMRKFGLFVAGGATVAAVAVMYMPVAPADTQASCSADSTVCDAPGIAGPVNQYPPITPGGLPPGFTRPANQYPPETPGALPPGLARPASQYPPITPGGLPPGLARPANQYPPETPGALPPGFTRPANQYPPETPGPAPAPERDE